MRAFFIARVGKSIHAAILAIFVMCRAAAADQIYFVDIFYPTFDDGTIKRVDTSGGPVETLVNTGGGLRSLAVDPAGGKIYWVDVNNFVIRRANLDGSGQEDLVTGGLAFPSMIRLDVPDDRMYWGDQTAGKDGQVNRAALDGSNAELVASTPFHRGIALDPANGKIYWSTSITPSKGNIVRANLDGSGIETVVTSADPFFKPAAIALDLAGGKIYWTDFVVDVVRRADLDGANIEELYFSGGLNPRGIALDLANGKVYWGQDADFKINLGKIMRMDLDGANPEDVVTGLGLVNDLALVAGGVPPCDPCDTNCDGSVNPFDIQAFVDALGPSPPPPCSPCAGDANQDGSVNAFDINAFVKCMGG